MEGVSSNSESNPHLANPGNLSSASSKTFEGHYKISAGPLSMGEDEEMNEWTDTRSETRSYK